MDSELIFFLIAFPVVLGAIALYNWGLDWFWGKVMDLVEYPFRKGAEKVAENKASGRLSVVHEFRVEAPPQAVRDTLDRLPGITTRPTDGAAMVHYRLRQPGHIRIGIDNTQFRSETEFVVEYRPEFDGEATTIGRLYAVNVPKDELTSVAGHWEIVTDLVLGELYHLDRNPSFRTHTPQPAGAQPAGPQPAGPQPAGL